MNTRFQSSEDVIESRKAAYLQRMLWDVKYVKYNAQWPDKDHKSSTYKDRVQCRNLVLWIAGVLQVGVHGTIRHV